MKRIIILLFLASKTFPMYAQAGSEAKYPEVGAPCPDLLLQNIHYYSSDHIHISDLKGQWTVLEFWSRTCSGCIAGFPGYNRLQHLYKGKIRFFLVGFEDKTNAIQPLYEGFKKRLNLELPVSFDSTIFRRLDINAVPYVIIVDPNGIVRGVTDYFTDADLTGILAGKSVELSKIWRAHESRPHYDPLYSFAQTPDRDKDSNDLYRTLLTTWDPSKPFYNPASIQNDFRKGRFDALGIILQTLYKYAYEGESFICYGDPLYGNLYGDFILETKDSLRFKEDVPISTNAFCYSLTVPPSKSKPKFLMRVMQYDLKSYFGYDVEIETRQMPVWKLIVKDSRKAQLVTHGGTSNIDSNTYFGCKIRNCPVSTLLSIIWSHYMHEPPFIDETGLKQNIDLTLTAYMPDMTALINGLRANGLDLIKGEKEMKAIVIRDSKDN